MGRPTKFTPVLAAEIAERLSKGESLTIICREDKFPTDRTVRNWMDADAKFSSAIARAREDGFDALAAECLEIADDRSGDTRVVGEDEREVCNTEFVQRAKLRIDTRLKLLAKWDPKRYGEKLAIGGDDTLGPLTVVINKPA